MYEHVRTWKTLYSQFSLKPLTFRPVYKSIDQYRNKPDHPTDNHGLLRTLKINKHEIND